MSQKKIGILLSYTNLIVSTLINIFLTPVLIEYLGDTDYSIYKVMHSFAGPLVIFNLGISTIVTRSIVKYRTTEIYSEKEKKNSLALSMLSSVVIGIVVIAVGIGMCLAIPTVYSKTYTDAEAQNAQIVFLVFLASTVIHLLTDVFSGCIAGNEKFVVGSAIALSKNVFKVLLMVILLVVGCDVIAVGCVDLVISLSAFVFSGSYSLFKLKERPKLTSFDKKQLLEMLSFAVAILLQAIVNQVNNNVDIIILGALVLDKRVITMYSSALVIYNAYNSMLSVVSNFFLPDATKLIANNASGRELTDLVIRPGRFNAIVGVGVIFGFFTLGKSFIDLWIGHQYINAYYVVLMFIVPVTIPLVENVAISILDASLKRMYRSVILVVMAVINVGISLVLISFMGFWGAALGTLISLIIGHGILMNVYYAKTFKMQIFRMFREIFRGILPSGILACLLCLPLSLLVDGGITVFILGCILFTVMYAVFLWIFGFNDFEKNMVKGIVNKLRRK